MRNNNNIDQYQGIAKLKKRNWEYKDKIQRLANRNWKIVAEKDQSDTSGGQWWLVPLVLFQPEQHKGHINYNNQSSAERNFNGNNSNLVMISITSKYNKKPGIQVLGKGSMPG